MLDMMKGYLQLAAGLGEMSRRKAMDAARELVEGSPVAGMLPGTGGAVSADAVTAQVAAVADELLAIGRQNRRLITQLVRTETQAVLASLGVASQDGGSTGALERQLRALRQRVDELERQLRERAGAVVATTAGVVRRPGSVASWASPSGGASTPKAAVKKAAVKKAAVKKAAVKKAAVKKTAVKKATPTNRTAKPSAATKSAATRAGSRTAGRTTAGTSTGRAPVTRRAAGRGRQQGATS